MRANNELTGCASLALILDFTAVYYEHAANAPTTKQWLYNSVLNLLSWVLLIKNGAQEMGSTPYPGTIQDLTFNLFSILADQRLSANALFWITALGRDPGKEFRG